MTGVIPALITPDQELHGPAPINLPGWEFLTDEVNVQQPIGFAGQRTILKLKVNPNLYRRRLFAYMFIVTIGAGFSTARIDVKYKGTPILSIPFNFGIAAFSPSQFSSGSLLGSSTLPISGSLQLNLSTPFNGVEGGYNPVYLYPFEMEGMIDEITMSFLGSTAGNPSGRLWLGCISQ